MKKNNKVRKLKKNIYPTIALVAARSGSKEIKKKNFLKFKDKYIVSNAVKIGESIKSIHKIILSSDSIKILNLVKENKKIFKIKRSKSLSRDNTPMLPVMKDAILKYEKNFKSRIEKLIILDPTSILRKKEHISQALKIFNKKKADLLVSVCKSQHDPYFSILEKKGKYYSLSKKSNKMIGSRQQSKSVYNINTVVWIYSREAILNQKKRIPKKTIIFLTSEDISLELNTKDDLNKVKKFISHA